MTRVLMTADAVGGVWTYALELIGALAPHRVEFGLATMGAPLTAEQRAAARALPNVQLFESRFALEWMEDPWRDVDRAGHWLLGLERTFAPDLVHLNGYVHAALPWAMPVTVVAHSCVLSWHAAVRGCDAPASFDTYRRRVARGFKHADAVVAPTAAMLRAVERHWGVTWGQVIFNARSPRLFQPGPKEPMVLTVGRLWDEAKNVAAVEACAPKLSWPVYAAGAPTRPFRVSGEPAHPPVSKVHHLGALAPEALAHWMSRAAICALPARYEPFGLAAVEAALCGCALVLGDIESLHEVWGDAALYAPPNDPDAIAAAVERLIADPALRGRLAASARGRALTFDPARQADRYLELYARLAPEKGARRCAS
jgi:glycosyltransferase involved in cell wall biosynthesis